MSQFFASGGQSIRTSASASVLPMNISFRMDWLDLLHARLVRGEQNYAVRIVLIPSLVLFPLYQNFIPEIPRFCVNMFSNSMTA